MGTPYVIARPDRHAMLRMPRHEMNKREEWKKT